jgi:hypothetical protein
VEALLAARASADGLPCQGFYTTEEAATFTSKLEEWKAKQLAKYDDAGQAEFKVRHATCRVVFLQC